MYKVFGYIPNLVYLGMYKQLPAKKEIISTGKHYTIYNTSTGVYKYSNKIY